VLSPHIQQQARLDGIHTALVRVPFFKNTRLKTIKLERLSGALTNASYKVTMESGVYVLRFAGQGTSEYVDRAAEGHNAQVAAAAGVNAEVLHFDAKDGTMLTRFVEGVTMDENSFDLDPGAPARAALALKRVHSMGRVFRSRFNVFAVIDGYLDLLRELEAPLPKDYYEVQGEAEAVRRALEASPIPLAPCHNDPWPGNLLDTGRRIYIIDWEYSGMNDPVWDLSDLSIEAGFGPEQDRLMMETYCGGAAPPALYSRLVLYKAMSDLHWSLWALIQHANDNPAEDFLTYALERLERCKTLMGSIDFGWHLAVVRGIRRPRISRHVNRASPDRRAPIYKVPGGGQRLTSSPSTTKRASSSAPAEGLGRAEGLGSIGVTAT
jgi:thiamine kinase-like enzyme